MVLQHVIIVVSDFIRNHTRDISGEQPGVVAKYVGGDQNDAITFALLVLSSNPVHYDMR